MNCGSRTGAHAVLPLADAGARQADVLDWWKRQPFDLGIPSYAGNCTLCMLKGRAKLIRLIRAGPDPRGLVDRAGSEKWPTARVLTAAPANP